MLRKVSVFKGGSLSSTCLMQDGGNKFVRKTVSLSKNREYGYQRWYSQLKKLQRYNHLFPSTFPKVLGFGINEEYAYFDIEYFEDYQNAHQFLLKCDEKEKIDNLFNSIISKMNEMHRKIITSNKEAIELYLQEGVEQKLKDCYGNARFDLFLSHNEIVFCEQTVTPFLHELDNYKQYFRTFYVNPKETFTHGNITLENLLYNPKSKDVIFIDPYEENIIDSPLAEYSQLLQSCNSKYELYNAEKPSIKNNKISCHTKKYPNLDYFNKKLKLHLKSVFSPEDYACIKLFEIAQFIHMLPFKKEIDEDKMIFFYGLASYLFQNFKKEHRRPRV